MRNPDPAFSINEDYPGHRINFINGINELLSIKNFQSKKKELKAGLEIARMLHFICQAEDLAVIISEIKMAKLLIETEEIEHKLDQLISDSNFSQFQETRVKAIVFSQYIKYLIGRFNFSNLFPEGFPLFDFAIHKNEVLTIIKPLEKEISVRQNHPSIKQKSIAKRIEIGALFLSGEADEQYLKLKSWRKVAKHYGLDSYYGQFSTTFKKDSADNDNDVFQSHQIEILDYCKSKKITINRKEYLRG